MSKKEMCSIYHRLCCNACIRGGGLSVFEKEVLEILKMYIEYTEIEAWITESDLHPQEKNIALSGLNYIKLKEE